MKKIKIIGILFGITLILFFTLKFIQEQFAIKDYQKRLSEAPVGSFVRTGDMNLPRAGHSAIKLNDGRVLIVGGNKGAEIFDPKTGQFKFIDGDSLTRNLQFNDLLLLKSGNVLVGNIYLFDFKTDKFRRIINNYKFLDQYEYYGTTASSFTFELFDGKILSVFCFAPTYEPAFYLYDEKKNELQEYKNKIEKQYFNKFNKYIRLNNDEYVIIVTPKAGQEHNTKYILWNTKNNTFSIIAKSNIARSIALSATLLDANKILVLGGEPNGIIEILDISKKRIKAVGKIIHPRLLPAAIFPIHKSEVLIIGGDITYSGKISNIRKHPLMSVELFDLNNNISKDIELVERRFEATNYIRKPQFSTTILDDGNIFIAGGYPRIKSTIIYKLYNGGKNDKNK